jgi:uncharacterized heparinase superfamily protein
MSLFTRLSQQSDAFALRRVMARARAPEHADPEPLTFGSAAVARRILEGQVRFGGVTQTLSAGRSPFGKGGSEWEREAHSFIWLDDLATLASDEAQTLAQTWTTKWMRRFGEGQSPAWDTGISAQRLIRQISHFAFLASPDDRFNRDLLRLIDVQTQYLGRRWAGQRDTALRLLALGAALLGTLDLGHPEADWQPLLAQVSRECRKLLPLGALPSRNPEDLLSTFALLSAIQSRLQTQGVKIPEPLSESVANCAKVLRTLRHADGALARFHGGDRGAEGMLDRALAFSGVRSAARSGSQAMGYCRLSAGRTSVITDATRPPAIRHSAHAHACALAFELTSGRRPVITNCGPGRDFGPDWALAGRATPSHSTLSFAGLSQARIAPKNRKDDTLLLDLGPRHVTCDVQQTDDGPVMTAAHDAYVPSHGLWHQRRLRLSFDGRQLEGEDLLETRGRDSEANFAAAQDKRPDAFAFALRFHLHPEARADVALNGAAVSITLKSGEVWLFRHDGTCDVALEPSVWLGRDAARPLPSEQIVLTSIAGENRRSMQWTLAKTQDTPRGIRDLWRDDVNL